MEQDLLTALMMERALLRAALKGLFEHCSMIHKHWGDACNQKEADAAIQTARELIAQAEEKSSPKPTIKQVKALKQQLRIFADIVDNSPEAIQAAGGATAMRRAARLIEELEQLANPDATAAFERGRQSVYEEMREHLKNLKD